MQSIHRFMSCVAVALRVAALMYSHFDKGVRVAVGVHGGQVGTADDAHQQAALLRVVAQRHQDTASLRGEAHRNARRLRNVTLLLPRPPVELTVWRCCGRSHV